MEIIPVVKVTETKGVVITLSQSSFPVILKVGNVDNFVQLLMQIN